MRRISEFFGIVIYRYYLDNRVQHTPHFHAAYAGEEVVVSIPDAEVLAGSIPPKKEKLVKAWAVLRERRGPPPLKASRHRRSSQ